MKGMRRNAERSLSYRRMTENGQRVSYDDPVPFSGSKTPAGGYASREMFGTFTDYDYAITSHDMTLPIAEDDLIVFEGKNHVIRRIAKNLNTLVYAVRRVEISE